MPAEDAPPLVVERYKYILQQIQTVNENVYRFFAIFQTLATAITAAALALFVSYSRWGIAPATARTGVRGLLILLTVAAAFTVLLVVAGILSWIDYRREECELLNKYLAAEFRTPPQLRNFYRWYETYILLFIIGSAALLWLLAETLVIPRIT